MAPRHNHKANGCKMTAVPGYTNEKWQGKKLGKICTDTPDEIAFAKERGEQIRAAKRRYRQAA